MRSTAARIFRDDTHQRRLEEDGYATFACLDQEELRDLRVLAADVEQRADGNFHISALSPNLEYRDQVAQLIRRICGPALKRTLADHQVLGASFMVKPAHDSNNFPAHADQSYVDENSFVGYTVWIPASDATVENGTMHVVPGSHWVIPSGRGPLLPSVVRNVPMEVVMTHSVAIPLRAGEAAVWDHRLIHFSTPNATSVPRTAVSIVVAPRSARLVHFAAAADGGLVRYDVDADFDPFPPRGQPRGAGQRMSMPEPVGAAQVVKAYGLGGGPVRRTVRGLRRRILAIRTPNPRASKGRREVTQTGS